MKKNDIYIASYAKFPSGITASTLYKEVVLGIILDRYSGEIKDVECSFVTRTARQYVKELLMGRSLNDVEEIIKDVEDNYFGMAKKSFVAVLINSYKRYKIISKE